MCHQNPAPLASSASYFNSYDNVEKEGKVKQVFEGLNNIEMELLPVSQLHSGPIEWV